MMMAPTAQTTTSMMTEGTVTAVQRSDGSSSRDAGPLKNIDPGYLPGVNVFCS